MGEQFLPAMLLEISMKGGLICYVNYVVALVFSGDTTPDTTISELS